LRGHPVNSPVTARWVIEFRLVYHLRMSPIDIGKMDDKEVMRYYHSLIIQKKIEEEQAKKQQRKAKQQRGGR
jgi:hypothetical protein